MILKKNILYKLNFIRKGGKVYKKIFDKVPKKEKRYVPIIVFPSHDPVVNYYGLLYMSDYVYRFGYWGPIVVTCDKTLAKSIDHFDVYIRDIIEINEAEMKALSDYFLLFNYNKQIVFISQELSEVRNGHRLLYHNGISLEELVAIGMYHLIPFEKKKSLPTYDGVDEDILSFMRVPYDYKTYKESNQ